MPSFDKLKFTANGLALQANAQAGGKITFSKIKLGKGNASGDISSLADLVNPSIEANIIAGTLQDNVYTVQANATNDGLSEGFYWTELGLFATDNDGNEVLYVYTSTADETDYIPSENESSYMKRVKIAIAVGNATEITFVKSDETYIDAITFNEQIDSINNSLSELNKELESFAKTYDLDSVKNDLDKQITEAKDAVTELSEKVMQYISNTDNTIRTMNSNIEELRRMIEAIPAITSGTSEPSGGEDGDVYVMYEE